MGGLVCSKCGEETPYALMQPGKTWCQHCHQTDDVDRHKEIDPKMIPHAIRVEKKLGDKIGVQCPYEECGYKILRPRNYFTKPKQLERCPKCMGHYYVRRGKAA